MRVVDDPLSPFGDILLEESLPADTGQKAPVIQRAAEALAAAECIAHKQRLLVEICLYEALSNALIHGSGHRSEKQVHVVVCADDTHWAVIVEDEGEGFDPTDVPDPTEEDNVYCERGRGIALMDLYLDDLRYTRKGNRVMLLKKREHAPSASAREEA